MSNSFGALALIILVTVITIVVIRILAPGLSPSDIGFLLTLAAIAVLAGKFWVSDILSSGGFDVEKTAVDLSLTSAAALFAIAATQQYAGARVIFPAIFALFAGGITDMQPNYLMWLVFLASVGLFFLSFFMAHRLKQFRAADPDWKDKPRKRGRHGLMRLVNLTCFTISYTVYMITVLYKA